jgi:hypothetical protein
MLFCFVSLCAMLTLVCIVTPACYQSTHFTSYTYTNTHPDTDTRTHKQTNKQAQSSVIQSYTNRLPTCMCPAMPKTHTPYTYDLNTKMFTHHTLIHTQNHPHHINMLYTYTYKCNYFPINPSPLLYCNSYLLSQIIEKYTTSGVITAEKVYTIGHSKSHLSGAQL